MIEVVVNDGANWLDYVSGLSAAGAAVFAGWAAMSARSAAIETRRLVDVERERDQRAVHEAEWRQARRMLVDLAYLEIKLDDGRTAYDFHLSVTNAGTDPVFMARLKTQIGDQSWGPQLIGSIPPGRKVGLIARIIAEGADNSINNGHVRFTDTEGRSWVASARGRVVPADEPVDVWIDEGFAFASQSRTAEEHGTTYGIEQIVDIEAWRESMAQAASEGTS